MEFTAGGFVNRVKDKVEFEGVRGIKATSQALLCAIDNKEIWVPQSQIDDDSEVYDEGHEGTLIVSEWWATKEGLV